MILLFSTIGATGVERAPATWSRGNPGGISGVAGTDVAPKSPSGHDEGWRDRFICKAPCQFGEGALDCTSRSLKLAKASPDNLYRRPAHDYSIDFGGCQLT